MNYDLLKLSKILPTIKGRRTLDIYQERLDIARKAQQAQQEEQESEFSESRTGANSYGFQKGKAAKGNKVQQGTKLVEIKSADKLPSNNLNGAVAGYSNLNMLLNEEEPFESLAHMVENGSKKKPAKKDHTGSSGNLFGKKQKSVDSTQARSGTISPNTTSNNFVFKKKRIILRDTNELDHVYHYSLGTGFTVNDSSLGLNGRKVAAQEFDNVMFLRQQKKFLNNMNNDQTTSFNGQYREAHSLSHNYEAQMYSSDNITQIKVHANNKIKTLKTQVQGISKEDKKVKTVTLDGTYLKGFEKTTPQSSLPGSPEKTQKGSFFIEMKK